MKRAIGIIFLSVAILLFTIFPSSAVTISSWAKSSYENLKKEDILQETFTKNTNYTIEISREDFANLLVSYLMKVSDAIKLSDNKNSPFKDTNNAYVITAYELGVVSGVNKNTFAPEKPIKREEAALMVFKAENIVGKINKNEVNQFKDKFMISMWARDAVGGLAKEKIISGMPDGNFYPKKTITVEESFAIVNNLLKRNKETQSKVLAFDTGDNYLDKNQYQFIFENIPKSMLSRSQIEQSVNKMPYKTRKALYDKFLKTDLSNSNTIISSPNLVFKYDMTYYIMGLETKKDVINTNKESQRVLMYSFTEINNSNALKITSTSNGTWITINSFN